MKTPLISLTLMLGTACGVGAPEPELLGGVEDLTQETSQALCAVARRELIVTDLSVVEDANRTTWKNDPATNPAAAAWTFGRLMEQMAGTVDPSDFTLELFARFASNHNINGFVVPARGGINAAVIAPWPKLPDGKLDLKKAPLRLLAIVNRLDLRKLSQGNAGEGRFVFGVTDPSGNPMSFTVILEYKLPATTQADVVQWATDWHALGALAFPSAAYNKALQKLTDRFAGAGVAPGKPNGSSISQIRTNEIALASPWQLREFHLASTGHLVEATVVNTPDRSFQGTATLASFINTNAAALIAGTKAIPLTFDMVPFRAGAIANSIDFWSAPGVTNNKARFALSVNTCNGCHGRETNTGFLQVGVRAKGQAATLSGFLTGIDVIDPVVSSVTHHFADLNHRATDLASVACPGTAAIEFDAPSERVH